MRVTDKMMSNNAAFWLARQSEALYRAEIVSATGKGVNQPSDDSLAYGQIMEDRATISKYGQYLNNTDQGLLWLEVAENVMESVYELIHEVKEIAVDQSADDLDTREALTEMVSTYYDQVVDLVNTQYEGNYLFGGSASEDKPFGNKSTVTAGTAGDIVFDLGEPAAAVTIEITDRGGAAVRTITLAAGTAGTNTVAWDGLDDSGNPVPDGDYDYQISAVDAAGDPVAAFHTYRGGDACKEVIIGDGNTVKINNDGGDIFSQALMVMQQTLIVMETAPFDETALADMVDDLVGVLDNLNVEMIKETAAASRLESAYEWTELARYNRETSLSQKEIYDANQAAIELQAQETAHEITLETTSLILNLTKLFDVL